MKLSASISPAYMLMLAKWLWRAWPIAVTGAIFAVHMALLCAFPAKHQTINKWLAALQQVVGALIILYSLNSNMGAFRNKRLLELPLDWLRSVPRPARPALVNIGGVAAGHVRLSGALVKATGTTYTTTDEHFRAIHRQLDELAAEFRNHKQATAANFERAEASVASRISQHAKDLQRVASLLEEVSVGSLKSQLFAILLVIYAALLGALA